MTRRDLRVRTPEGPGRLHLSPSLTRHARATLVLGHGAGAGVDASDLVALADELPLRGVHVVRVEQPWQVARRAVAPAPPRLDASWRPCVRRAQLELPAPLVVGGRSAGARVACRTAVSLHAVGVLALAFPLLPPRRPGVSRALELQVDLPLLVIQGSRDPFGAADQFPVPVVPLPDADHSMRLRRPLSGSALLTARELRQLLVERVARWIADLTDPSTQGE